MDIRHKHEPPVNKDATPHCKLSTHTRVMNAWSVFNLLLQYHHGKNKEMDLDLWLAVDNYLWKGGPLGGYTRQRYGSEMQYHLMGVINQQFVLISISTSNGGWRITNHLHLGRKKTQAPGTWECNARFLSSRHIGTKNQRRVDSIRVVHSSEKHCFKEQEYNGVSVECCIYHEYLLDMDGWLYPHQHWRQIHLSW